MRTIPLVTKLALTAVAGAILFTGCSTATDPAFGQTQPSALAFTPPTYPHVLVTWGDQFPDVRVIETHTMIVPVVAPADTQLAVETAPAFAENLPPGSVFYEAAGDEPAQAFRVIRYTPTQR